MELLPKKSADSEPARKRQAVGGNGKDKEDHKLKEVVVWLAKLGLANAQTGRMLKSLWIHCWRYNADHWLIVASKEGTVAYSEANKEMRDDNKSSDEIKDLLGTPGVHGFNSVMKVAIKRMKEREKERDMAVKMEEAANAWATSPSPWRIVHRGLPHFKVARTFQGEFKRLEVCLGPLVDKEVKDMGVMAPTEVWEAILNHLSTDRTIRPLEGMAPPGDLERKLQDWLDSMRDS